MLTLLSTGHGIGVQWLKHTGSLMQQQEQYLMTMWDIIFSHWDNLKLALRFHALLIVTVLLKGKYNIGYSGKTVVIGNNYLLTLNQYRLIMNMLMYELNGESKVMVSWFHDFWLAPPEQRYLQNRETTNIGLVSSAGRASARQSESRRFKSRLSKFVFVHPKFIMRKVWKTLHNSLGNITMCIVFFLQFS